MKTEENDTEIRANGQRRRGPVASKAGMGAKRKKAVTPKLG